MEDVNPDDLRRMVLAFAATGAREVVAATNEGELSFGLKESSVEVGGVTWHLTTKYFAKSKFVGIQGHPERDPQSVMPHPFAALFVDMTQTEDDGSFSINLPADWLPAEIETTMEPAVREGVN